jgi:hypothetical protein
MLSFILFVAVSAGTIPVVVPVVAGTYDRQYIPVMIDNTIHYKHKVYYINRLDLPESTDILCEKYNPRGVFVIPGIGNFTNVTYFCSYGCNADELDCSPNYNLMIIAFIILAVIFIFVIACVCYYSQ